MSKRLMNISGDFESELEEVKNQLNNIIPYTINYFKQIRKKFGKGKER
jgi:topoisomerase-4 subunit A